MSRVIAIIKTAKDAPLWKGLPPDYPVSCAEYDSLEEAETKHPGALVMRIADYHEYAKRFHEENPSPKILAQREAHLIRQMSFFAKLWYYVKTFLGGF